MSEENFVVTSNVVIREVTKKVAKDIIVKNHYSHRWTMCSVALGVYYKQYTDINVHFDAGEKLIGAIIYGHPVGRDSASSICTVIKPQQVFELTRLWIADGYGKNIESYSLGKSFDWLRQNRPDIKCLISYADPEQGHSGKIYQATNWLYQDAKEICAYENSVVSLDGPPNYNWIHSRTLTEKYGSNDVENLKKTIGKTFWIKKKLKKLRYIYVLPTNKKDKKRILNNIKHPIESVYPDIDKMTPEIQKIEVSTKDVITGEFF
jgi:hypothetical protein